MTVTNSSTESNIQNSDAFSKDYLNVEKLAQQAGISVSSLKKALARQKVALIMLGDFTYVRERDYASFGALEYKTQAERRKAKLERDKMRNAQDRHYITIAKLLKTQYPTTYADLNMQVHAQSTTDFNKGGGN